MSTKKMIAETLNKTAVPWSYNVSTSTALPKIVFSLVSNVSTRLSNRRHSRHPRYQIMFFSDRALDVESDPKLSEVESLLEGAGLHTTDWMEVTDADDETEMVSFSYLLEVVG